LRIPNNYLAAVAHGKNGEISADDGILNIPPIVVPAFPIPRPGGNSAYINGLVVNDSTQGTVYIERVNQAAADQTAFYLLAGLWTVELHMLVWYNFAHTDGSFVLNLDSMDQAGSRGNVCSVFSQNARGYYSEHFTRTWHIKPRPDLNVVQGDVWTFILQFCATNAVATNKVEAQLALNFQRFL
jgi:hypothetical protein